MDNHFAGCWQYDWRWCIPDAGRPGGLWQHQFIGLVIFVSRGFFARKIFSHLSKMLPRADGGPYAYSREGLGDFAGFLVAWGYGISTWCTNAAIAVSFVSALSTFFPAWQLMHCSRLPQGLLRSGS